MAQVAGWKPAPEAPGKTQTPAASQQPQGWASAPEPQAVSPAALPKPAEIGPSERGFFTNLKADTIGMAKGMYHAAVDPASPEEQASIEKERQVMPGQTEVSHAPAGMGERFHSRVIDQPRERMMAEPDRTVASTILAQVPLLGPAYHATYRKVASGDYGGAAADVVTMMAGELAPRLPEMARTGAGMVRDVADIARSAGTGRPMAPARPMPPRPAPVAPMTRSQMVQNIREEGITRGVQQAEAQVRTALPPSKSAPWESADYQAAKPFFDHHVDSVGGSGVERFRDTADASLDGIEGHLREMIAANPQDRITTNPREAARASLAGSRAAVDSSFVEQGMQDLARFNLDNPTVAEADAIRWKINQENKGVRLRNHYDQATARATDPAYAAREAAADSLREGVYGKLAKRDMPGAAELRQAEGSIIRLRNAAEKAIYTGDKPPAGSGGGLTSKVIKMGARKALPGIVADAIVPDPLTRNELLDQAMRIKGSARPAYPAIPAAPQPAGLLTEGARPPIITPPPAAPPDTSGTPAVPETGPQKVHPLPPRKPPSGAGQVDITKPAEATGGTMAPVPEQAPPLKPEQKLLPEAHPGVPGQSGKGVPMEQAPKPPKTPERAASQPAAPKQATQRTTAKPMARPARLTIPGVMQMTDVEALRALIDETDQTKVPPKVREAAYRRYKQVYDWKPPSKVAEVTEEGKPVPKVKAAPALERTPKAEPVAKRYSPEIIEQAEGQMRGASELGSSMGRPGRYHIDLGEEGNTGTHHGAKEWYGIGATKPSIAGQFPWFADESISLSRVDRAIEKGKGADYEYIMEKIARTLQDEEKKP